MNASLYAKPVIPRIVVRPMLVTLLLHGALFALLIANWEFKEHEVVRVAPVLKSIDAKLVDASDLLPKPQPQAKPPAKPKPPVVSKPEPKPEPKPKPKQPVKPKAEAKPEPRPEPKPAPKVEPKPEPKVSPADLVAMMQEELAATAAAEQQATADELANSFAGLIQQTVVGYWSRPPSARNGMETLLEVQLIPTGEVVSVNILRGSGNTAFDRSAINAVEKAGAFPELQRLPSGVFEDKFRRFRLLFRPEDLRY